MRTKILFIGALLSLSLAACQQDAAPVEPQSTATIPAPVAPAPQTDMLPAVGDGVVFDFPYVINKDHGVPGRDGVRNREILIEYSAGTLAQMDERVRQAFKAKGYARPKPATRNGAVHSIYRKEGQADVHVWIREGLPPGERFTAKSQSMLGTIYMVSPMAAPAATATAATEH